MVSLTQEATSMASAMKGLSNFRRLEFESSSFVKPASVVFSSSGRERRWDLIDAHDSLAVLLYHVDMNAALIVRQFRPAVYSTRLRRAAAQGLAEPAFHVAFTYELCAGLVDKTKSLSQIAHEEILEECGYDVPPQELVEVTQFTTSIGVAGCKQNLFFAKVTEAQRREGAGGGVAADGEMIELLALPVDQLDAFMSDTSLPKSTSLMFALMWLRRELEERGANHR
eukprot:evm.model.scf_1717.2 EVM.evm.TU.scf_1717.2   scf_1717:16428-20784(+)